MPPSLLTNLTSALARSSYYIASVYFQYEAATRCDLENGCFGLSTDKQCFSKADHLWFHAHKLCFFMTG